MSEFIQVFTTYPDRGKAEAAMRQLVEARLAACAQVTGPIKSVFRWEGKVETAEEWLCLIKTSREMFEAVEGMIKAGHPYAVPEVIATAIDGGNVDYLAWMRGELAAWG